MDNKAEQFEHPKKSPQEDAFEADRNLIGFFDLLLQVDRRNKEKKAESALEKSCVQDQPPQN